MYTRGFVRSRNADNILRASVTLSFASVGVACMDGVSAGSAFGGMCGQSACQEEEMLSC